MDLIFRGREPRSGGQVLPQDVMFLGGVANLRTLKRNELEGAGRVTGRADLLLIDELGKLLHLPLPAWMPLQLGTFASTGAVWGRDPVTGAAVPTTRYQPNRDEYLSEVGVGLNWRVGIPEPLTAVRVEIAFPLGPDGRKPAYALAYQQPLNLLPPR